jgi:hypothetical protein
MSSGLSEAHMAKAVPIAYALTIAGVTSVFSAASASAPW